MSFVQVADPNSQSGETGFLNVIANANFDGIIQRFLNYNGRFEIYPDCTGGVLMFNVGQFAAEWDFYFEKKTETLFGALRMVRIDSKVPVGYGQAEKQGPS